MAQTALTSRSRGAKLLRFAAWLTVLWAPVPAFLVATSDAPIVIEEWEGPQGAFSRSYMEVEPMTTAAGLGILVISWLLCVILVRLAKVMELEQPT